MQVYAEFQRITNQNLPNTFYAELDRHTPRLMALFRQKASKTGQTADALADIFKVHDTQVIIQYISEVESYCNVGSLMLQISF
jgi:hemoglobin-like flavoprotein